MRVKVFIIKEQILFLHLINEKFQKYMLKYISIYGIFFKDFAELCNGSTIDSGSVCEGSNPSSAAKGCKGGMHPFLIEFF